MWNRMALATGLTLLLVGCASGGGTGNMGAVARALPGPTREPAFVRAANLESYSDQELLAVVDNVTTTAKRHLNTDQILKDLRAHRSSQDRAKIGNVLLTAATGVLGTVGSLQSEGSDALAIATGIVGAASTVFVAVRDDRDVAERIATCSQVAKDGNTAIDTFEVKWRAEIVTAPAQGTAERAVFAKALGADGAKMIETVDKMMTDCH
jgi:hypothetical protein